MKKKLGVLFLLVVLFSGSAFAFAWWDNLETDETVTIGVGQGVTLNVTVGSQTTGNLVPSGVVEKTGDVTEVVLTYNVVLSTATTDPLNLTVEESNVLIDNLATYSSLVNIVISAPATISDTSAVVTITVTLTLPANQTEYDAVANKDITFDLTFTATP
ncbi:hypothetical protein [Liberiplasma polymorphum]|uniref:hypothetical protein n=1 Tax=Liberiplasma polymorphum TaxID=3374570 RepID=UPI003773B560